MKKTIITLTYGYIHFNPTMRKLLTILFLLITSVTFGQIKVIKVQGMQGVYGLANNVTGDSLIFYVNSVRHALPTVSNAIVAGKVNYTDSTVKYVTPTQLAALTDTIKVVKPAYIIVNSPTNQSIGVYTMTDSSLANSNDTTLTTSKAVREYVTNNVQTTRINVNSVTAVNAPTYITTPTFDGSGQTVHPDIYYNANGKFGYKYWMVYEPYTNQNDTVEKVSLMCSNDGITWVTPPNVTNPIEPLTGLNAGTFAPDGDLMEGLDGKLYIFYNASTDNAGGSAIFVRSYDGNSVSAATKLFNCSPTYGIVSPAVTIENGIYVLRAVNISASPNTFIKWTTNNPTSSWIVQPDDTVLNMPSGLELWHLDIHKIGDELHAFVVLETLNADNGASQGLFFASSEDGHSWTIAQKSFLSQSTNLGAWDAGLMYRASAYEVNTPIKKYKLYYSARDTAKRWHIGVTTLNLGDTILDSKANANNVVNLTDTQTVAGLKTFTNRIIISKAVQSAVALYTTSVGQNWAIVNSDQSYGDLAIKQSTSNNGDPFTGTVRLYFSRGGAFGIGTVNTVIGDGTYGGLGVFQSSSSNGAIMALRKPDTTNFFQGIYYQDKALNSGWVFGVDFYGNAFINHGSSTTETAAITDARSNHMALSINPSTNVISFFQVNIPTITDAIGNFITRNTSTGQLTQRTYSEVRTDLGFASGTATLASGTVTVSTTFIKTGAVIFITRNTPSGTLGFLSAPSGNIVNGTSFVINSSSSTDNSTVYWKIINP